ncbi:glycosyl transferase family 1 [Candidatus Saccharibacteria bacterium CG11_big_fil_rev_8_21_14_0_20_41_19]|nr:MAG: glycosyl transferase family 1 [Candidatus Saccharibacteria bacterium CG2_30_41_52]PIQ71250.1 MAG: glycosyl transferase family 1 [Candidatus Saccharibacteria bacterium CG11_big_fil_rev_8_21_14_0_20_41_19]PIZ59803.1 MAG: glycosyl transferase family 1 [Candidatus Saccharibacteria bacterium CG_4_10_14_0_2_um_filter_41_11]PJC29853.1 MAG: glycosyl transferase family 1 [Candidatus Saccharibacteria bacterium CG_4_9_14_0_2_um_filter_41_9]PJE66471.1 MAG: glycosyl transferase family 1 [Candidatus 
MSHIAIDARIINSSTGTYVERLLTYLQEVDTVNQYSVIVPFNDVNYWKPTATNFKVITADFKNYSLSEQIGFKRFLDKLHPDLVHFCMPQQPILYKGKHVTTFHDLTLLQTYNSDKNWFVFHTKQQVGKFVFKSVAKSSQHIITPTKFTKNELVKFAKVSPDKITVTYEAADVFIDQLTPYKHPFNRYILYVGQQSDYKNIRRLGDAHQKLLSKYPDLGLILVGKKNASIISNEKYFTDKKYRNILFTDFIPNNQRDWLYTNTAAYMFPSLMEGFGLPGLEAMGYGAPIVSSSATCLPEVYGDAALYFDPTNTDDIASAINQVLSDDNLRNNLIKKGHEQIKKYSWKRMAEQTYSVYKDAIK